MPRMQANREDQKFWVIIIDDNLQDPKLTLCTAVVFENSQLSYPIKLERLRKSIMIEESLKRLYENDGDKESCTKHRI